MTIEMHGIVREAFCQLLMPLRFALCRRRCIGECGFCVRLFVSEGKIPQGLNVVNSILKKLLPIYRFLVRRYPAI